jgi:hypothetical protein
MNRPVTPEAIWFESRGDSLFLEFGIVGGFGLGGRDVADGFEKPPVVEPVRPFAKGRAGG